MTPLIGSVAFAALWSVLAIMAPSTSFHFAPVIVAAWPGAALSLAGASLGAAIGLVLATQRSGQPEPQ